MRMPIQYALTYPEREAAPVPRLDWSQNRMMTFSAPDTSKFPCLRLAYDALRDGGSAPCTLNAADEIAVEAFLEERISFPQIAELVEETLNAMPSRTTGSIEEVLEIDREARAIARRLAAKRTERVTA
jgi:1-deoxy-D-xylulose-5-phosphate reductoisomerase